MEQVFSLVNRILALDDKTTHLKLRTFRVIPLQPLAGLLEWVQDAVPIGDYLAVAHERFHKGDLTPKEARNLMKHEFENLEASPDSKYKVYSEQLCPRFTPVFGKFFLETSATCSEWYDKRRLFTLSAAVASMVGHIVGMGDRHCQNIMIDVKTGELIHIDLNMIFEMGKTLRIPELVPFRLTRDIVDGMGVFGLEAAFTANAIRSMSILRSRQDQMLMILEVFKYDPLYRWTSRISKTEEWQRFASHTLANHNTVVVLRHFSMTMMMTAGDWRVIKEDGTSPLTGQGEAHGH